MNGMEVLEEPPQNKFVHFAGKKCHKCGSSAAIYAHNCYWCTPCWVLYNRPVGQEIREVL